MANRNHVVKLAQSGFDVKTAGDENLIYNSNWPLLKIYKQGSVVIPDVTQDFIIAEHDLGFPPAFWYFTDNTINGWKGNLPLVTEERSEFFGPIGGNNSIKINNSKLIFTYGSGSATGSLRLYYYIFALDLTKLFKAPIIKVGQVGGRRDNFVFKIAKENKDISSDNLDDFVIHSDTRSPLIHSVTPGIVNETTNIANERKFEIFHGLGYIPMFFGYSKSGEYYTLLPTGSGGSTIFESDENKVLFREGASGREITILILKDPFVVDYSVSVSI